MIEPIVVRCFAAGLTAGCLGPAAQRRYRGDAARPQHVQEGVQIGQANAACLADGGDLRLLVRIQDDGLGQLPLQPRVVFFQVADAVVVRGAVHDPLATSTPKHRGVAKPLLPWFENA